MRVIAGIYKRRPLLAPKGDLTRPTGDRVKENLFNILAPEIDGAHVLDLFAGSGALGIEALSRGAKHAVFVENNKLALASIHENLKTLQVPTSSFQVVPKNVDTFLAQGGVYTHTFDIVFADPPYQSNWQENALTLLENSGFCAKNCLFVMEKPFKNKFQKQPSELLFPQNWALQDVRKYGKTQLEFWRRQDD